MSIHQLNKSLIPLKTKKGTFHLSDFLILLNEEEKYFSGEQHNTKLMFTRLRKIFYDNYGWNTQLIRGTSHIEGRYEVKLILEKPADNNCSNFHPTRFVRKVTVRANDRLNPNAGSTPEIYANQNQQVILPNGLYCDIGHVLGGIDAYNHKAPVTPLPNWLMFIKHFFPLVNSNVDVATWLGDIASVSGEFLFKHIETGKKLNKTQMQNIINEYSPGVDLLGDIDPYIICQIYNTKASKGLRVTEILNDFYEKNGLGYYYSTMRFQLFAHLIGLKNWNGICFSNEKEWALFYSKQLKNNIAFYIFSRCKNFKGLLLALITWLGGYKNTLMGNQLLSLFIDLIKQKISTETKTL
ncbi:MAG: hypothetical protein JW717_08765 [Marinilabiliaceae bacterium]|nr:hypothetical protein [Marinilabiliaceae bacterium]